MEKKRKEAKMKMLKALKELMAKDSGEGFKPHMDGMQKVTVMAKDEKGLEEGLDKAKEIMKKREKYLEECEEGEYKCGGIKAEDGGVKKPEQIQGDEIKEKPEMDMKYLRKNVDGRDMGEDKDLMSEYMKRDISPRMAEEKGSKKEIEEKVKYLKEMLKKKA